MIQLTLWQAPPVERPVKIPVFRVIIKTKLYVRPRGQFLQQWLDVIDSVLFTADGEITDDQLQADYLIVRNQGVRIHYEIWRAHCPELYDKELICRVTAGHSYKSSDTSNWKKFTKANKTIVVNTVTDYRCLGNPA